MLIKIEEIEYIIKSRQAIEILHLVEKSGLLEKTKAFMKEDGNLTNNPTNILEVISVLPFAYDIANQVLAIATGEIREGKVIPNTEIADNVDAMKSPMYALQLVKQLLFPIQYVISSDPVMEDEKKSDSEKSEDTKPGTKESLEELKE